MSLVALRDGTIFQRLSTTRQRVQSSAFVLSFQPIDSALPPMGCGGQEPQIFLGFVLPKKLVKRAVDRNQIKRWARTLIRTQRPSQSCAVVIKARSKVVSADLAQCGVREELAGLVGRWVRQIRDVDAPCIG